MLESADGQDNYIYHDNSDVVRTIGGDPPSGSSGSPTVALGSGTVVGTQTSYEYNRDGTRNKVFLRDINPDEGLQLIASSSFRVGKYSDGAYNETEFVWPYAEESPWLMQDPYGDWLPGGRSHSAISHSSLNSLSIQALHKKISMMESEVERLKGVTSDD